MISRSMTAERKKRRRSRKGLEKSFICSEPDCGKAFTRSEHLARHQLNHRPKEIFHCTHPGCPRTFVRQDLRLRHLKRHENQVDGLDTTSSDGKNSQILHKNGNYLSGGDASLGQSDTSPEILLRDSSIGPNFTPHNGNQLLPNFADRTDSHPIILEEERTEIVHPDSSLNPPANNSLNVRNDIPVAADFMPQDPTVTSEWKSRTGSLDQMDLSLQTLPSTTQSTSRPGTAIAITNGEQEPTPPASLGQVGWNRYDLLLPRREMVTGPMVSNFQDGGSGGAAVTTENLNNNQEFNGQQSNMNGSQQSSPMSSTSELISWLFSDAALAASRDPTLDNTYLNFESPMSLPNLLSPPSPPSTNLISEEKRIELFEDLPTLHMDPQLTLPDIRYYIQLYWEKFYPQYPILHRPLFSSDETPGPLLWSMILLGAAFCRSNALALRIAEQLRWVIFGAPEFHPPAQLWVLQSLLHVEFYEKLLSSRSLHERAHIHHGTLIQLIRRGSSMTENSSDQAVGVDPWHRWIQTESTKRTVFLAFYIDVMHAALFNHAIMFSAHEIRLTLPCDDETWDAYPTGSSSPHFNRAPNMPFLTALKKSLKLKHVRTGQFGRQCLLAGLTSIALQMNQRDLQASSLGWNSFRAAWRNMFEPAFEFWRSEYESQIPQSPGKYLYFRTPMVIISSLNLHLVVHNLETVAGAPSVANMPVRQTEYDSCMKKVTEWAQSEGGRVCVLKALHFAREALQCNYRSSMDDMAHRMYVLKVVGLIIWAYGYVLHGPESLILARMQKRRLEKTITPDEGSSSDKSDEFKKEDGITDEKGSVTELSSSEIRIFCPPQESAMSFLNRMLEPGVSISSNPGSNHTVGLLRELADCFDSDQWELSREARRLLVWCTERSLGCPTARFAKLFSPQHSD